MCCPFTEIIERASNNKYKSHWNLCIICLFTSMEVNNEPQTDVWRASEWTSFVRSQNMCGDMRWCVNAYASRGGGTNGHWHTLHTHTHAHVHVKWTVRLSKTKKESPSWLCSRIRSGVKLALPLMSVGRCVHIAASEQIHNHQCELAAEWRMVRMHVRFVRCRSHDIRTHIVRIRNATTKEEWTIERRAKKTRAHVFNTTTMATLRKVITCADARETK